MEEGWHQHDGGRRPVPPQQKLVVRYRNGTVSPEIEAKERRWEAWPAEIGESEWDIVAWRKA